MSDVVSKFQVKKLKINCFMNEKPQNLEIAINNLKLNETFWKFIWKCIVQWYDFVENFKITEWYYFRNCSEKYYTSYSQNPIFSVFS